jgi:hypothetical protein
MAASPPVPANPDPIDQVPFDTEYDGPSPQAIGMN